MRRARVWGREALLQGSPWTFVEYRREFGGDLLADFMAEVGEEERSLDAYLRICWALERTADRSAPRFDEWLDSFPEFTLADGEGAAFVSVVDSAVMAELFRPRQARPARVWRAVRARWLGWLSRRRRAREARLLARRGA